MRTDHNSLVWLMRFKHIEGQLSRWLEELSTFDMDIMHWPGKKHGNADGLSRMPSELPECACYSARFEPSALLCGGCGYCVRAHHQWSRFENDVDDVIPLAVKTPSPVVRTALLYSNSDQELAKLDMGPSASVRDQFDPDATLL